MKKLRPIRTGLLMLGLTFSGAFAAAQEPGLLFHLSGDRSLEADYARGNAEPVYRYNVDLIPDGARNGAVGCGERQLLTWWAHENIYAQRGTLSFYWRGGSEPFTETPFPIFRVGYSDHSSWDMVWLRIDWNGHGFDAFVTDANLARIRSSYRIPAVPDPKQWMHFALTWDENEGIRFYINGRKVGQRDTTAVFDADLDQFGPHSRIISPYQVQSAYNFQRGGDLDELRIYDRALSDADVADLSAGKPAAPAPLVRDLNNPRWRREWNLRYGWNRPGDLPPYLENGATTVRKVQILEAYDLKRWWWKASDGIRETTWPGVYNRSRITGRNDYFQLPDWDCYSTSGWNIRFNMPDEEWNHLEVSGGADGRIGLTPNPEGIGEQTLFTRPAGSERTFHRLDRPVRGQTIVFANNFQETPIGEFDAFLVRPGDAPPGTTRLSYTLTAREPLNNPNTKEVEAFIRRRYPADEISIMQALSGAPSRGGANVTGSAPGKLPIVHVVIPSDFRSTGLNSSVLDDKNMPRFTSYTWHNLDAGLDGIRITLPAMDVKPVEDGLFPMNIRVKDPVWSLRNMFDFSFSIRPNEARVLWLDLRDRILPNGKALYLTIAGGGPDFTTDLLEGARIELVFKNREEAKTEHVADRFTQIRDNHAMIVEEHPRNRRLNKFNQIEADFDDLFRVDPSHRLGQEYWYVYNSEQPRPAVEIEPAPKGVPEWAHLQLTLLKKYRWFIEWMIDNRQIDNGEFGGGLSDDTDFANMMPPLAMMGVMPDKIDRSLEMLLDACYNNGMFDKGMSAIMTDGLHTFEEGINTLGQLNLMRPGDPKQVERMMETIYGLRHWVTGINAAGHRHFRSDYYSGSKIALDGIWAWSSNYQPIHFISAIYLSEFYGIEEARQTLLEITDGYLAHATTGPDGRISLHAEINYQTDSVRTASSPGSTLPLFWASWKATGEEKYLKPVLDRGFAGGRTITSNLLDLLDLRDGWGPQAVAQARTTGSVNAFTNHVAWQVTGNKDYLSAYYANQIASAAVKDFLHTEGSIWIDRLNFPGEELQRSRLGGVANARNAIYSGHAVTWRFPGDDDAEQIAILVPYATQKELEVEFFNTKNEETTAEMTGADVLGGTWRLTCGEDTDGDGRMDRETGGQIVTFGRNETVTITIPPRRHYMIKMTLSGEGEWLSERADLAIGRPDVVRNAGRLHVTVHNIGSKAAPAATLALVNARGETVATAAVPAIAAANDLKPKTAQVTLSVPGRTNLAECHLVVDPEQILTEISTKNNTVSPGSKD
jgi:hypothetical protein